MLGNSVGELGDIPSGYITTDTWFHFALTWDGPGQNFNTFINGGNPMTSVTSKMMFCDKNLIKKTKFVVYHS